MGPGDAQLVQDIIRLGRAFRRLGLHEHATSLRVLYLALRAGITKPPRHKLIVHVDAEWVLDWLRILRIPPHDRFYPVLPRRSVDACPNCGRGSSDSAAPTVTTNIPGGWKVVCIFCGTAWLELEGR